MSRTPSGRGWPNLPSTSSRSAGCSAAWNARRRSRSRTGSVAGHLYRIAQEAVNNALKHANATEVRIRLAEHG